MRAAFGTPGFKRLYLGLTASMPGDALMLIVLSMWIKQLTGSNGAAGLTFLWLTIPALLAPLFGYVVDRVPRRAFLVGVNLGSALAMLPLLLVHDASDVWITCTVAFLYGVSFVVMPAALNGLLKDMLREETLVEANASLWVTREALRLVGPLSGAALFALAGGAGVAVVDAVSFVVAAVAIGSISVREAHEEHEPQHWRAEVAAGIVHVRRTPALLHSTLSRGRSCWGSPCSRPASPASRGATELWQLFAALAVLGAGLPLIIVAYNTLLQRQTPGRLMGRVSTATEVLITTPQALSIALGALLVSVLDYRLIFVLMTAGTLAAAGYLATMLRGRMRLPVPVDAEAAAPVLAALAPVTGTSSTEAT